MEEGKTPHPETDPHPLSPEITPRSDPAPREPDREPDGSIALSPPRGVPGSPARCSRTGNRRPRSSRRPGAADFPKSHGKPARTWPGDIDREPGRTPRREARSRGWRTHSLGGATRPPTRDEPSTDRGVTGSALTLDNFPGHATGGSAMRTPRSPRPSPGRPDVPWRR